MLGAEQPMPTPKNYWLIKSEPYKYSFAELVRDKSTMWDGVRNYEARNSLRSMCVGDVALFYHSNDGKEVVGVAKVRREAYPDPTAPGEDWSVVDVEPVVGLKQPVPLELIKSDAALAEMSLLKRSRLSVVPVTKAEFEHILKLGKTSMRSARAAGKKAPAKKAAKKAAPAKKAPAEKVAKKTPAKKGSAKKGASS